MAGRIRTPRMSNRQLAVEPVYIQIQLTYQRREGSRREIAMD